MELTLAEWNLAVEQQAAKIMAGEKVKQLSQMFDAPQYAQQFIELAKKAGNCRDLRIRAKCMITDADGRPVINKKTKALKVGWVDYTAKGQATLTLLPSPSVITSSSSIEVMEFTASIAASCASSRVA